jgi:uncharacterized repeat protein (TIGR03803 family)
MGAWRLRNWSTLGRHPSISRLAMAAPLLLACLSQAAPAGAGPNEHSIFLFGNEGTGAFPDSGVVFGPGGALYGATISGGPSFAGTIFRLTPPRGTATLWTETLLYEFTGTADGARPQGIALDKKGAIYGVAQSSGTGNCSFGCGTVFKLSPPPAAGAKWIFKLLYSFKGGADGGAPLDAPLLDASGAVYGVTGGSEAEQAGGVPLSRRAPGFGAPCPELGACGNVYRLTPPATSTGAWKFTVLYNFPGGKEGAFPMAGVIIDPKGVLYGTTQVSGNLGPGLVFSLSPRATTPWPLTHIHDFAGGNLGEFPIARLTRTPSGFLFGTAGGGTSNDGIVFRFRPPSSPGGKWTGEILYNFKGGNDGESPRGQLLIAPPNLVYGVTQSGGPGGEGTVFRLAPPAAPGAWTETLLDTFFGAHDGGSPLAGLVRDAEGVLYGTTDGGGNLTACGRRGCGVVFKQTPPL